MMKPTKFFWRILLISAFCYAPGWLRAQGTTFTYQGRLNDGGSLANGHYDLNFQLYNAETNGAEVGPSLTNIGIGVTNGLFTMTLDFGQGVFAGQDYWLQIGVRTNGSADVFTLLSPLQELTAAPYAVFAGTASNFSGTLPAVSLAGTYGNALALTNVGNGFAGDGSALLNVNANTLDGFSAGQFWNLTGNSGIIPGIQFLGTTDSNALEFRVNNSRAFLLIPNINGPNIVGGASNNWVDPSDYAATIAGGYGNALNIGSIDSTISGGDNNAITNSSEAAISGGGYNNIDNASDSSIGGGGGNSILFAASFSTITGGWDNIIQNSSSATINGGFNNLIEGGSEGSSIGGELNTIEQNSGSCVIAGGTFNDIQPTAGNSVIAGGYGNTIQTVAESCIIGGGLQNNIGQYCFSSTIAGGIQNTIQSAGDFFTIGGGYQNTIESDATSSTIAGGDQNVIQLAAFFSSIGGGIGNTVESNADTSTISGGAGNTVQALASDATVGGGYQNVIQSWAVHSTIAGGCNNTIQAGAAFAVIPGGSNNLASGNFSFAAGCRAQALNQGAFVWADSQNTNFASTNNDSFNVRAQGGVIFSDGKGNAASWTPGSGSWNFASDRNLKDRFAAIDELSVLDKVARLPMAEWSYKGHDQRHIGAMAQDFHALFPLNGNDKVLNDADLHGVELAAIKGLNQKVNAKDAEIQNLKQENELLQKRLERLEESVRPLLGQK